MQRADGIPRWPKRGMDDERRLRLTQVRGIGRWTVEMLLMSWLGRPDVLPVDDYASAPASRRSTGKRKMPAPKDS